MYSLSTVTDLVFRPVSLVLLCLVSTVTVRVFSTLFFGDTLGIFSLRFGFGLLSPSPCHTVLVGTSRALSLRFGYGLFFLSLCHPVLVGTSCALSLRFGSGLLSPSPCHTVLVGTSCALTLRFGFGLFFLSPALILQHQGPLYVRREVVYLVLYLLVVVDVSTSFSCRMGETRPGQNFLLSSLLSSVVIGMGLIRIRLKCTY